MYPTTSFPLGWEFSREYLADRWYTTISDELTSEQQSALVDALIEAEVNAFDALLPESHYWLIHTSELQHPHGDDTELGDLKALHNRAIETVMNRLPKIEADVLARLA